MAWINELFHVEKPIIAMLHLDALPGDPAWRRGNSMEMVVAHARADLLALQEGGVDGFAKNPEDLDEELNICEKIEAPWLVNPLTGAVGYDKVSIDHSIDPKEAKKLAKAAKKK